MGRFVITRCLCNANLGAETRISACGANFGHVGRISDISDVLATAKFDLCIFFAACGARTLALGSPAEAGAILTTATPFGLASQLVLEKAPNR